MLEQQESVTGEASYFTGIRLMNNEFFFRMWIYPEDADFADIETWVNGIELEFGDRRPLSEYAAEAMVDLGVEASARKKYALDPNETYQLIGRVNVESRWSEDGFGDQFDVVDVLHAKVPEGHPMHHDYDAPFEMP